METLESLDIKEAAVYLDRSERSVRRYLHAGRLEYTKEPLSAGGFKYMITAESLELLRSELDTDKGRRAGVDMSTSDGLAEHLQGLQATVQAQADQIAKLTETVEHLSGQLEQAIKALPPARAEDLEEPEPDQEPEEQQRPSWWRNLWPF
jgi:hypothetical protein